MDSSLSFAALLLLLIQASVCLAASNSGLYSALSVQQAASGLDYTKGIMPANEAAPANEQAPAGKRAVFYSENKLRSVVQTANYDLRQLKRDFMAQMTDIYLALKMDQQVGYPAAQMNLEAGVANMLVGAEFADLVIKKFTIERRLLAGLKSAFVRFMPMESLVRLYKRYDSMAWLRHQSQCELRNKLPEQQTRDDQMEALYSLIEARARVRAADDVIALTADGVQRILQTYQWFLIESKHGRQVTGAQLAAMAQNAQRVTNFYIDEVVERAARQREAYLAAKQLARPLFKMYGGKKQFLQFVDEIINIEVLDIDLNAEAASLDLPPTINGPMIDNLVEKWIPTYVLKSVEEDRQVVMDRRASVMHLVRLHPEKQNANFGEWAANIASYVCRNSVHEYRR